MAQEMTARTKATTSHYTRRMDRSRINRLLIAVEILILIGVIVLFNAFPERVGIYSSAVEPYLFVPLLSPEWLPYVPWLNTWWVLALTLALVKLVYGRWTRALRWADLGLHLLSICVLFSIVLGVPQASADATVSGAGGIVSMSVQQQADLLFVGFKSALGLALVGMIVGFFTKLTKMGMAIPVLRWR